MRGYSVIGSNASGSSLKTIANIIAATTVRPAIYEVKGGNVQTPADQAFQIAVKRHTAVGTAGTNPTPQALDPQDVAAVATAGQGHSGEPTYTAGSSLFQDDVNQRSWFRWVAVQGYELKAPATANNGLGLQLVTATAAMIVDGTLFFFE